MQIKNTSQFRTDDLRIWIKKALDSQGAKSTGLVVKVTGARPHGMRGRARIGTQRKFTNTDGLTCYTKLRQGNWMLIRIDSEPKLSNFAWLLMHEIQHLMGVRHGDMTEAMRKCWGQPMPAWAEGLVLRKQEEPPKRSREEVLVDLASKRDAMVAKRAARVKEMYERALRKEKTARATRKKWEAKVRYYERKEKIAAKSP